jgi:hypothetical protein
MSIRAKRREDGGWKIMHQKQENISPAKPSLSSENSAWQFDIV